MARIMASVGLRFGGGQTVAAAEKAVNAKNSLSVTQVTLKVLK